MLLRTYREGNIREWVAIILDKFAARCLSEWERISSRIIRARFHSKFAKTTVLQCYAPTENADGEEKEAFCNCLQE